MSCSPQTDQIRLWPIDVIALPPKALVGIRKLSLMKHHDASFSVPFFGRLQLLLPLEIEGNLVLPLPQLANLFL